MLEGLSGIELGRLRISVGYGTHKKGRPLTPMEVALLVDRARAHGASLSKCAQQIRIDESGLGRFLRLLELPDDLRHLVDWGGGPSVLSFTCATEVIRIRSHDDMRAVAEAVLEHRLTSKETRQTVQLLNRSDRSVADVVREVLNMRPVVERHYVFIGLIDSPALTTGLADLTQREKDAVLAAAVGAVGLAGASGRLGQTRFTLVGDESFGTAMSRLGADTLEERLTAAIAEELQSASPGS